MNCPVCDQQLREIERSGIHVDVCPGCKGVWLDRGELEKLLERESGGAATRFEQPPARPQGGDRDPRAYRRDDDDDDWDDRREGYGDPRRRRKKGFLGEIFDIFD